MTPNDREAVLQDPNLRGIGWIVLRARDREGLVNFYKALGFEEYGRGGEIVGMHAGNGAILEIGHIAEPAPNVQPVTTRKQRSHVTIVGCRDSDAICEAAKAAGSPLQELIVIRETRLWYITDPEYNIVGFATQGPAWPGSSRESLVDRLLQTRGQATP